MPGPGSAPKIVFVTAGGAGMYCGSCMRDNALVRNLLRLGWNAELIPAYTPIRTDEEDVSVDRVFLGGINLYLRQAVPLLRALPPWLLSWLDRPAFLRRVASGDRIPVDAGKLGALTLAILTGESGALRQEHRKFAAWLGREARPALVNLTNLLIGGCIPLIRRELPGTPILVTLQGDDLFLDQLTEPWRSRVVREMQILARSVDRFITFSADYAGLMSELLDVSQERFDLVPLGIDVPDLGGTPSPRTGAPVVGYFARICPEKGFQHAVDAFLELAQLPGMETVRFQAGGWLGAKDREFFQAQSVKLERAGLRERFHYAGSPDGAGKWAFLREIDVFSVPTEIREPKGISVLEALAAGAAVVQPAHGAFPELLRDCPVAQLVEPRNPGALAGAWHGLLSGRDQLDRAAGAEFVRTRASAAGMARATAEIYRRELAENRLPGTKERDNLFV